MPPCAVPVWDRVGYSFEMTAVLTSPAASRAARRPAPPAPTITASYTCVVVIRSAELRRVEREHDHRGAVDAMEQRQGQEHPVPGAPERARPAVDHEVEVHPGNPGVEHVHDEDVADRQEQQQDPRQPHEEPRPQLEPDPAGGLRLGGARRLGDHRHQPNSSSMIRDPMIQVMGTIEATKTSIVPQNSRAWWSAVLGQKSMTMMRRPFSAW